MPAPAFRLLNLALLLVTTLSCGPTVIYEETHPTGTDWAYADVATFNFSITDTTQAYDLEILVEHGTEFPYENFYLNITTTTPAGITGTEMISLDLAGDFGVWNGDCSGERCELAIPILLNTRYASAGKYEIRLEQNSRDERLPAINTIGLRLLEAELGD